MFLFVFSILSRRCPLLATFLPVLICLLSLLISDSRFDLVWFRLSCDHGWIRSGSVNVRKTTKQQQQQQQQREKANKTDDMHRRGTGRTNPSHGTKFSGANGDRERHLPGLADHEQDWQQYTRLIHTLLNVLTVHPYTPIQFQKKENPTDSSRSIWKNGLGPIL